MNENEVNEESMEASSVVPEGVRELLEQRSTYREWLERLDEVGADYRPAVAERVRSDYEERLAGVARELEGHRHELESSAKRRRDHLGELTEAFEARSAELEEAELRFQVGEFDDGTWEEMRTGLNAGLEEIESELDGARAAVEELEQILGELTEDPDRSSRESSAGSPDAKAGARPPLKALDGGLAEGREAAQPSVDEGPVDTGSVDDGSVDAGDEPAIEEPDAELETGEEAGDEEDEPVHEESVPVAAAASPEDASSESASELASEQPAAPGAETEADEYRDELEFLESLSLDDPDSFDAVSRMLEDEEDR